jgi:hypothetical protein
MGGAFHWGSHVLYKEDMMRREFGSHSELTEEGDRHRPGRKQTVQKEEIRDRGQNEE